MTATLTIDGRKLITCHEAARLYGCTMGYIRRLCRDGKLHCTTLGRTYLVDADEVHAMARDGGAMCKGFVAN